jgi:CRP-like cAMP-binding protein
MAAPTRQELEGREAEVHQLVKQDQRDKAGKILLELIVSCAGGGDITNATRLRDMLYEVDPMALGEIIKVNEIIEQAMSGSIDEQFDLAWSGLRQSLTDEEFLALYHALDGHEVGAGKSIVKAGSKLDALFLINKGNVNVTCQCAGKSITVKTLEPGSMIGGNCFQPSVWTVSLASLTPVSLGVLRLKELAALLDRFPGLESKLTDYYEQFDDIPRLLKDQGEERRRHERFRADQRITFQVQGRDGTVDERTFRGELDNISPGGLAFLMRIVNREKRRLLFGRRLVVSAGEDDGKHRFTGDVAAVTIHNFQNHDYAVHLAFDTPVSEEHIQPLTVPEPDDDLPEIDPETDSGGDTAES